MTKLQIDIVTCVPLVLVACSIVDGRDSGASRGPLHFTFISERINLIEEGIKLL